jgi:GT2 family glycosyltransferase
MPDFRVIVADDCSSPRAESVVPPELGDHLRISYVRTPQNAGPGAARNLAIEGSRAEFIAFLDDDVDADPDWLFEHLRAHDEGDGGTVTIGPLLAPSDWNPTPWNRWEAAKLAVEYGRMQRGEYEPTWRQFFTGNAVVRRSLFQQAGGFNPALRRAEDIELGVRMARLGATFRFVPTARGWHYAHRSSRSWLLNAKRYAEVDAWLDEAYPELRWRALIEDELGRRAPSSRLTRKVATKILGERVAVATAMGASRLLNHSATAHLAVRASSLAYDVRYRSALRQISAERA